MKDSKRVVLDCRMYPNEIDCTLTLAGSEDEVLDVAVYHAYSWHGYEKTPEFLRKLKSMLKEETVQSKVA